MLLRPQGRLMTPERALPGLPLRGLFFWASTVKRHQPDIVNRTVTFWSERTEQTFSREDARQMLVNVTGFFAVLAEWNRKGREEERNNKNGDVVMQE